MSEFRFKRFTIDNTASALKVGTDSVLLGSLMSITGEERRLLDIGTGTGVVAIMAAQRIADSSQADQTSNAGQAVKTTDSGAISPVITAIEIDGPSAQEAGRNFAACPWSGMLEARHCALQNFRSEEQYDLIFSNPPYFDESLRNPDPRESRARHTESLSYREVLAFAREQLAPQGRVSLILPAESETAVRRCAAGFDLNFARIVRIRTTSRKPARRIVVEFTSARTSSSYSSSSSTSTQTCSPPDSGSSGNNSLHRTAPIEQELTIQDGSAFTEEYRRIAGAFLLYL